MWYLNISTSTQSVPVGNGNVVAVRPNERVEVIFETEGLLRLKRQRKIIITGRQGALSKPRISVAAVTEVTPLPFAVNTMEHVPAVDSAAPEDPLPPMGVSEQGTVKKGKKNKRAKE